MYIKTFLFITARLLILFYYFLTNIQRTVGVIVKIRAKMFNNDFSTSQRVGRYFSFVLPVVSLERRQLADVPEETSVILQIFTPCCPLTELKKYVLLLCSDLNNCFVCRGSECKWRYLFVFFFFFVLNARQSIVNLLRPLYVRNLVKLFIKVRCTKTRCDVGEISTRKITRLNRLNL